MTTETFKGSSTTGDLNEALASAFDEAKQGLKSSLINWTLVSIAGQAGGFVDKSEITVTITASPAA